VLHPNHHGLPTTATTTTFGCNNMAHLGTYHFYSIKDKQLVRNIIVRNLTNADQG
jgi:hypothetical protein